MLALDIMFIDTHCHLNLKEFDEDLVTVIGNAKKAGVKQFIVPGVDDFSSKKAIELTQQHPGVVFAAVGFHPYEAQNVQDVSPLKSLIAEGLRLKTLVALGECGLDYHIYDDHPAVSKKDNQKRLFEEHLLLALKQNLPVIMHVRDAYVDFFDVLDSLPTLPKGVIHCFSGGLEDARRAHERNLLLGFDGNITYSKHLSTIIPQIPLDQIVLETDSPYLTPVPHRGTRNEPKYIPIIAGALERLMGIPHAIIMEQTTKNATSLFSLMRNNTKINT